MNSNLRRMSKVVEACLFDKTDDLTNESPWLRSGCAELGLGKDLKQDLSQLRVEKEYMRFKSRTWVKDYKQSDTHVQED